ncbi:Type IV secretory pathway component [Parashewanella curva]|uniref:Type IV secretory pathway component n=1 Tax=Parashewanella curva TaxID=2338552 RepID=A0A3L8PZU1_9GAMM|nr:VirB8/TrbF family protein [Parashewanella curva]RLV60881.1 Type IV secretory pathway component [Parashewanella curva]
MAEFEQRLTDKQLLQKYFAEARGWDAELNVKIKQSEQRAWKCCLLLALLATLLAISLITLMPLKSIEPFVIRVDNNTGFVDVVSTLTSKGQVKQQAQEVLDKYFLAQYLRHREGYQWQTRTYDRKLIGLMSDENIQQDYGLQTDPKSNSNAPINLYGQSAQVLIKVNAISFIAHDKNNGEQTTTALVRYTKRVKQVGEDHPLTHWVATITFTFRNAPMSVANRQLNPLGFQVLSYRNDQATGGD